MGLRCRQETLETVNTGFKFKSHVSTTPSSWMLLCSSPKYSSVGIAPGVLQICQLDLSASRELRMVPCFSSSDLNSLPLKWGYYCQLESHDGQAPQMCLAPLCLQWQQLPFLQTWSVPSKLFLACSELNLFKQGVLPTAFSSVHQLSKTVDHKISLKPVSFQSLPCCRLVQATLTSLKSAGLLCPFLMVFSPIA